MKKYLNSVVAQFDTTQGGNAALGTTVTVRLVETGAKATIYSDNGVTVIDNPLAVDSKGNYEFYAADGRYNIIQDEGLPTELALNDVSIFDVETYLAPTGRAVLVATTETLIESNFNYPENSVIYTLGYALANDDGGGQWYRTEFTDTPSRSPAQRGNATLTDARGVVWQYVNALGRIVAEALGSKGDNLTDNTAVWSAIQNSGFKYVKVVSGVHICSGITVDSDFCIEGSAGSRPTLKMINAGNQTCIYGPSVSNVTIRDVIIDGNKTNQSIGTGNNWRGIYFLGDCANIDIENVTVKSTVDHGIFFSNGGDVNNRCGRDSTIRNVIVTDCGSQAHIDAGGAGGTGFVGGQRSTHFISCVAYGNHLNGFKSNGTHTGCESYDNIGGGYETGFDSPSTTQSKWVQCSAENNGGTGWRNQGEGDELTWVGCLARGNGRAGILLLNAVNRATIDSCWFAENGQLSGTETRTDTEGFDGITITGTSANPDDIIISGCQFYDDQATKTQEYHIYMRKMANNVTIGDNNIFGDAKLQAFYAELDAQTSNLKIGKCFGLSTYVNETTAVTVTGTTAGTTITDHIVNERSLLSSTRLRLTIAGDAAGVGGTKAIRLQVAGAVQTLATFGAGDTGAYYVEAEIVRHNSTAYVQYKCYIEGVTVGEGLFTTAASFSSDMIVRSIVQLGNAGDSVTQQRFTLEQV